MKIGAAAVALLVAMLIVPMIAIGAIAGVIFPTVVTAANCTGPIAAISGTWRAPLVSRYAVTSGFGMRYHPVLHRTKLHTGIDLVAGGDKTIAAAAAGVVKVRGYNPAYGNQVVLDHGGGIETRYAHMSSFGSIKVGQQIGAGTKLGVQGATGYVTGAHLHFEVMRNSTPIEPKQFMAEHDAALNGRAAMTTVGGDTIAADMKHESGIRFELPGPGTSRKASLTNKPLAIPAAVKELYVAAASKYKIPWTLLAGIGMEETGHGRNKNTSTAGAKGLMQFMPSTWRTMGVDGDGDDRADILNAADSVFSAANYLTKSGVSKGEAGVRRALFAYDHADWYVNDVLFYAHSYGGGTVLGGVEECGPR